MTEKQSATSSFPFVGALQLILITLKLAQIGLVAAWPWYYVFAPTLLAFAVVACVAAFLLIIFIAQSLR